jgi:hypothetical protein
VYVVIFNGGSDAARVRQFFQSALLIMARHHFVVLIDQGAGMRVMHCVGRNVLALREFGFTDDSDVALLRWCQQFPQASVSFLSNLADEHYHVETLTHVRGAAQRQLLLRKLAAWPFAQGMYTAFRLNSVQNLRKENRFLFVALFCPPLLAWLSGQHARSLRIHGIHTQALTLPYCLPALPTGVSHRLSIQCTSHHVRISYLQQHRLFLSRFIPLSQEALPDLNERFNRVAQEANQIRMTLIQQRWVAEADLLQIVWLGQAPFDTSGLKKHLPSNVLWTFVSAVELSRQSGCSPAPNGIDVLDWMSIQPILRGQALPNLAPQEALLQSSIIRIKRYVYQAGAVMIALMLLAGWIGVEATQSDFLKIKQLNHHLQAWQPVKTVNSLSEAQWPQVSALTQTVQKLEASLRSPADALQTLQNISAGLSHWQLKALEWNAGLPEGLPNEAITTDAPGVQDTLTATWLSRASPVQASAEWAELLSQLHNRAEIEKVEIIHPHDTAGNPQRLGDTRQLQPSGQQILKLYFKQGADL